jgi:peptidoglycan/xylan/chitin deacetylase (PgdA/CDA1 family)
MKKKYFCNNNNFFHGVMFHHFHNNERHSKSQGSINSLQLEKIIKLIGKENIINSDNVLKIKNNSLRKKVCFTFDDCLKSQYDIALPILEKHKIKAFFFVYTGAMTDSNNLHEVCRYFRQHFFKNFLCFYNIFYKELLYHYSKEMIDRFIKKQSKLIKLWKKKFKFYSNEDIHFRFIRDRFLSEKDYSKIMIQLFKKKKFKYIKVKKELILKPKDVRKLFALGHEIGLHTHSHPTFLQKLKYKQQLKEYALNLKLLKKIGIKKIRTVSHPNGSYNGKTLKILKRMNIKIGFRQVMIKNNIHNKLNLKIPRIDHSDIVNKFKL